MTEATIVPFRKVPPPPKAPPFTVDLEFSPGRQAVRAEAERYGAHLALCHSALFDHAVALNVVDVMPDDMIVRGVMSDLNDTVAALIQAGLSKADAARFHRQAFNEWRRQFSRKVG